MSQRTLKRAFKTVIVLAVAAGLIAGAVFGARQYFFLRYPRKYSDIIEEHAGINRLPTSFVYAVVRTESSFRPDAVSEVDASGLMQITKDTFEWIQGKMDVETPLEYDEHIFDPEVNVRYGTYLLGSLYREYGSYTLALCAYHAGRGNVNAWLSDPELSADGETLLKIPFRDTQWYVTRVLETREIYQKIYKIQ